MRGTSPPPIVPEMSTTDEPTASPGTGSDGDEPSEARRTSSEFRSDGGLASGASETSSGQGSDGGEYRSLSERTFGAPLVPDCS